MQPHDLDLYNRLNSFVLQKIAPSIMAHGGNVEILELKDHHLKLALSGSCLDCSLDVMTKEGIAEYVLNAFPELEDCEVLDLMEDTAPPRLTDWVKGATENKK